MSRRKHPSLHMQSLETRDLMDALPVLLVIADQQHFFYREYNDTRNSIMNAGIDVVVAATTTNPSTAHANSGQGAGSGVVVPQIALANVNADNYSAIAFVGGWGSSMYQYAFNDTNFDGTNDNSYVNSFYNGDGNLNDGIVAPQKIIVNNLINEFLADNKFVAGVCHGTTVLAWARVNGVSPVQGKNVTVPLKDGTPAMSYNGVSYANGFVMGQYNQMVANGGISNNVQGSIGVPGTTTDDVVVDGRIITGSDDFSAAYFGQVIAQQVLNAVNVAPTNITLSANTLAENLPSGHTVGTLTSTDANAGDTFSYSLVAGTGSTDNGQFTIVGNTLRTVASFNYEGMNAFSIRLRTTDAGGLSFEKVFTVNVTNVNETPTALTLSNNTLAENLASNVAVGNFTTTDPDAGETFAYALANGTGSTDNALFTLDGNTLRTATSFNYEAQSAYSIRVRTTDAAGLTHEQAFTINISNVNEAPTNLTLSHNHMMEGLASGTVVGTLTALDGDAGDSLTFSLVDGIGSEGNSAFAMVGNQLHTAQQFDRAVQASYSIRVRGTDAAGLTVDSVLTIFIDEVNDAPTLDTLPNLVVDVVAKNTANPTAIAVSELLVNADDAETASTLGIAIIGRTGIAGTWEYATSAAGPWSPVFVVSESAALLVAGDAYLRFKPAHNATGYAGVQFLAWDGVAGATGNLVDPSSQPLAFSDDSETAWVGVGTMKYDSTDRLLLPSMAEDKAASKMLKASTLLGYLPTEFAPKTRLGIAITAVAGNGTWQVRTLGGWQTIAGVTPTDARLLLPTDVLRFVPAANWNGEATLTYQAWDTTNDLGDFADPTNEDGFSSDNLTACLVVNPVNDAPLLETNIARLASTDPQPVSSLLEGASDIDSTLAGIAITRVGNAGGWFEYRFNPTSVWTKFPAVSLTHALRLDPWSEFRFMIEEGATTANGTFEYKAADDSAAFVPGTFANAKTTAFSKATERVTFWHGNNAPTFAAGLAPTFPNMTNGQPSAKLLVGSVLNRMQDSDPKAKRGMAVQGVSGEGTWQYSLDRGQTWLNIGTLAGEVLLLRSTDRLRFIPDSGWTGTASITFAAWDQTNGTAGDYLGEPSNSLSAESLTATLEVQ